TLSGRNAHDWREISERLKVTDPTSRAVLMRARVVSVTAEEVVCWVAKESDLAFVEKRRDAIEKALRDVLGAPTRLTLRLGAGPKAGAREAEEPLAPSILIDDHERLIHGATVQHARAKYGATVTRDD
ncbi:MAG: hypothetical protein NZ518_03800, partial [Dehalococcoidia bacterium]|nr:hypothetical protein [Dehalococcoidia bacterium]